MRIIGLTNVERERQDLQSFGADGDLMAMAQQRAIEVFTLYNHQRPDGTHVVQLGCDENVGTKSSAFLYR